MDSAPDHDFQRTVAASLLAFDERITRLTHAVLGIEYLLQVIFTMTHEGFASDFGKNVEARAFVGSDVPDEVLDRLEGFWRGIKDARARRIELEAGGEEQVTVEGRLLKVEQATAVLSDLMRIVYAAHAPSRSLLNEASKSLDQHGHPEPVRQAHERFRDEVGEVAAELAKRRRARRAAGKAQAAGDDRAQGEGTGHHAKASGMSFEDAVRDVPNIPADGQIALAYHVCGSNHRCFPEVFKRLFPAGPTPDR